MKKSFILYYDQAEIINELTDEQAGKLLKIIYSNGDAQMIHDPVVRIVCKSLMTTINRDNEKYEKICERNRINGLKGGRPPNPENPVGLLGTQNNPEEPKKADSDSDSDSDSESDSEKDISFKFKKNVSLPNDFHLTEYFKDYIAEKGCADENHMDYLINRFKNYHVSKGNKFKDWNMAFRNWVLKDKKEFNKEKYAEWEEL